MQKESHPSRVFAFPVRATYAISLRSPMAIVQHFIRTL